MMIKWSVELRTTCPRPTPDRFITLLAARVRIELATRPSGSMPSIDEFTLDAEGLDKEACLKARAIPKLGWEEFSSKKQSQRLFFLYWNVVIDSVTGKPLAVAEAKSRAMAAGWCSSRDWDSKKPECGHAWANINSAVARAALDKGEDPAAAAANTPLARLNAAKRAGACVPLALWLV